MGSNYMAEDEVAERQAAIDEAAKRAGRDPSEIVRAVNAGLDDPHELLDPERLARISTELGFEAVLATVPADDPIDFIRRLGEEAAPRARELEGSG